MENVIDLYMYVSFQTYTSLAFVQIEAPPVSLGWDSVFLQQDCYLVTLK